MSPMGKCPLINSNCTQCLSLYPFHQLLPPGQDPIGEKTFTHRRHLPIASIRYDAWSIRYLIVVAYGYLSRENWDLIGAMGKCRQWVNVAYYKETAGHGQLSELWKNCKILQLSPLGTVAIYQRLVVAGGGFFLLLDLGPGAAAGGMGIEINTGYSCYLSADIYS